MRSESLISIITVVYNGEKALEQTMLSVLNQSYSNIEYIIIDGASTDGTLDIITNYELRIKNGEFPNISFRYISESDEGIYYAMNKGIDKVTGQWINFMNAGDTFYSNSVIKSLFTKSQYLNVDVLYGHVIVLDGKHKNLIFANTLTPKNIMPFCHQSVFVKTNIMQTIKFDTIYKIMADRALFYKLYFDGYVFCCIDEIVSMVKKYGFSTLKIVKSRTELNSILKKYGMISSFMAVLYLFYAVFKDNIWSKIFYKRN
jgi:glycosyltransferase involved in cell wall biosynthesis